jgi:hypothetical protein
MSNFIQIQQPVWRIDPDALRLDIDVDADFRSERDLDLSARSCDNKTASPGTPFDTLDVADCFALHRFHGAAHQLMVVEAPRFERRKRALGDAQFLARKPLDILNPRETVEPDHWPAALHARRSDCQCLFAAGPARLKRRTDAKPLVDEIRFRVDHHLPADAMGAGNTPDQHHFIPGQGSVPDIQLCALAVPFRRHRHERAQRRRRSPLAPDDLSEIARRRAQLEYRHAAPLVLAHPNRFGMIDQGASDDLNDVTQRVGHRSPALQDRA